MPPFSVELDRRVEMLCHSQREAIVRLWTHPRVTELVPSYLFRMNCQARASVDLMEMAVERLSAAVDEDPVARGMIDYLTALIPEERRHDEWLLEGLEALGLRRQEVLARIPPPAVAAMVGSQYYWIRHHHPVALLGYIKVVENRPASMEKIEGSIRLTGLPRDTFRYHIRHATLELKHNDDLDRTLDELPLTDAHKALIGVSATQTAHHSTRTLENIVELFDQSQPDRAAEPLPVDAVLDHLQQAGAAALV